MNSLPAPAEDFRARAARHKRDRMRARLLDAVLAVYEPGDRGPGAVIDDVVRRAEVSRGTFYKYFETLEQAVAELGQQLAEQTLASYADLFAGSDPAVRAAGGTVLTLARAAMEPRWGLFTASVDYVAQFARRDSLGAIVSATLVAGRDAGVLRFASGDAATDMVVGAAVQAIERLAHGEQRNRDYILEMTCLCMTGLGMPPDRAREAANGAWARIAARAADLPWWTGLD
ncbi:MAG TPA: TetR family transcriptional regulator [Porticoccaceae bacterium]|nr:TetR family transcriptional regulator [Porticoccaceae bacterium]